MCFCPTITVQSVYRVEFMTVDHISEAEWMYFWLMMDSVIWTAMDEDYARI